MAKDYYVGLDCGVASVGWAVTDEEYNLLRSKGKTLSGSHLFDEAKTAEERRIARSARRRTRRSAERIKFLNLLFKDEMEGVDPEFFLRLKQSFLLMEDKKLRNNSKNTLFNDANFTDKNFHDDYPTIWHLRKAIIEAEETAHFDLRLYYLAIHHILRHRGHFLREGKIKGVGDFTEIFRNLQELAEPFDLIIKDNAPLEEIITDRKLLPSVQRKRIKESIFAPAEDREMANRQNELAGLLVGASITPAKIFGQDPGEEPKKLQLSKGDPEEQFAELEKIFDQDQLDFIEAARRVYEYGMLADLMDGEEFISVAMVNNYDRHAKELAEVKRLLKPFKEDYDAFFKTMELKKDSEICYNSYVGKAYIVAGGRKKSVTPVSQEDINKKIKQLFEKHNIKPKRSGTNSEFWENLEQGKLLPKQRGQAKGTIPQQLHHNELEIILKHLEKDYPSFAEETDEKEYNTKSKKILRIHDFRIPYYCGPLVSKEVSQFSWGDREITELVRPWNFSTVDVATRAENFIKRMTNQCTYLPTEDVLPKSSLLYQKYMVLNELNNLKINGHRIDDIKLKQKIYENAFEKGELAGNVTINGLEKWLRANGLLATGDKLSGSSESKFLPKLSTHQDFQEILGPDYRKKFANAKLERTIEFITVLNGEPEMLEQKILETLGSECSAESAHWLARKRYADWGRFSKEFLSGIRVEHSGAKINIIDALYSTNYNLMELLGSGEYNFAKAVETYNKSEDSTEISYEDVNELYCSPAVKRSIWRAIKIVDEIVKINNGQAPAKIFIESTRSNEPSRKGQETTSRYKELKNMLKSKETKELLDELEKLYKSDPGQLRSKRVYLYFTQLGKCAYTGEGLKLEELTTRAYDIDHIYPRSKVKDDSIRKNLVLVKAESNREKGNDYPIKESWRKRMHSIWSSWFQAGNITREKYERLVRSNPLTPEELSGFIARQIVETGQTVKALRDLLMRKYPSSEIIFVKAEQVSSMREYFAKGNTDASGNKDVFDPKPEFVKIRELNDLHHAKDAYLNIVVGNVMHETFTDDPLNWLKRPEHQNYSINPHAIWKAKPRAGDYYCGWNYQKSIDIISKNMSRNYALCTRMTHEQTGKIAKLTIVSKTKDTKNILPIRKNLPVEKYGGYNSIMGAYFALIETKDRRGNACRKIVQIPIASRGNPQEYLEHEYGSDIRVIISKIPFKSLLVIDGYQVRLCGRTKDRLILAPALQFFLDHKYNFYLHRVLSANKKLRADKNFQFDPRSGITAEENLILFNGLCEKALTLYKEFSPLKATVKKIIDGKAAFAKLSLEKQCKVIENTIALFQSNTTTVDLSDIAPGGANAGECRISNDITNRNEAKLILQSPTGVFERTIDLRTTGPLCPGE